MSGQHLAPNYAHRMTARAICFDLDGTLVDSLGDIINSFRAAIAEQGFPEPAPDVVRPWIGLPLQDMFAAMAPEGDAEVMSAAYQRIYRQRFTETSSPFPRPWRCSPPSVSATTSWQ